MPCAASSAALSERDMRAAWKQAVAGLGEPLDKEGEEVGETGEAALYAEASFLNPPTSSDVSGNIADFGGCVVTMPGRGQDLQTAHCPPPLWFHSYRSDPNHAQAAQPGDSQPEEILKYYKERTFGYAGEMLSGEFALCDDFSPELSVRSTYFFPFSASFRAYTSVTLSSQIFAQSANPAEESMFYLAPASSLWQRPVSTQSFIIH